ncbi:MAG: hypothetical protein ACOWWO_17620, partial [Peptococcaceae bacterium]
MSHLAKSFLFILSVMSILVIPATGCSKEKVTLNLPFDLTQNAEGWGGGFADLPVDYEQSSYQLDFGYIDSPLGGQAFMISSMNRSDDIFMYIKKRLTDADGLSPNTTYLVTIEVTFATSAPAGAMGIGGAPGEAVYVKVGAASTDPMPVDKGGFYELSVDKGQQGTGSYNAVTVGNVAKEVSDDFTTYELKTL